MLNIFTYIRINCNKRMRNDKKISIEQIHIQYDAVMHAL